MSGPGIIQCISLSLTPSQNSHYFFLPNFEPELSVFLYLFLFLSISLSLSVISISILQVKDEMPEHYEIKEEPQEPEPELDPADIGVNVSITELTDEKVVL